MFFWREIQSFDKLGMVIGIIAILMAILMRTLNKAREQGRREVCLMQTK